MKTMGIESFGFKIKTLAFQLESCNFMEAF